MSKKTGAFYKTGVLFLVLVFSLGCLGVSAASWCEDLNIKGLVATGDIDPVFTGAGVVEYYGGGRVDVDIHSGGKGIFIKMTEVYPGTYARIEYTVTNRGSIPVKVADEEEELNCKKDGKNRKRKKWENVEVVYTCPEGVIDGNGGKGKGSIEIRVNDEGKGFEEEIVDFADQLMRPAFKFDFSMVFSQWNAAETGEMKIIWR